MGNKDLRHPFHFGFTSWFTALPQSGVSQIMWFPCKVHWVLLLQQANVGSVFSLPEAENGQVFFLYGCPDLLTNTATPTSMIVEYEVIILGF